LLAVDGDRISQTQSGTTSMILRGHRHPLTPPTGQIRHGYPLIPRKVHLRLGEDPPAAGATYPHVIRTADFESELEGNAAMWG